MNFFFNLSAVYYSKYKISFDVKKKGSVSQVIIIDIPTNVFQKHVALMFSLTRRSFLFANKILVLADSKRIALRSVTRSENER